jgi:hypothetical protein
MTDHRYEVLVILKVKTQSVERDEFHRISETTLRATLRAVKPKE